MPRSTDPRTFPPALRRKAVKLYGEGHTAISIANELNVSADSVRRWAKEAGVKRGKIASARIEIAEAAPSIADDESLPAVRALKAIERKQELHDQLAAVSTPAEQFRALLVANGMKMLETAFQAPPTTRNMRDLKTLTEIIGDALGVSGKKGGTGGGRLSIDINVLTSGRKPETIDAEIVEPEENA